MTVADAPPATDWQHRALTAEAQLKAVLDECWVLDGLRHAVTYRLAADRVRAAIAKAEEPDAS